MEDELRNKLKYLNAATDAKISQQREQNARADAAARQLAQDAEDRERSICNAAERLSNNWLDKVVDDFKDHAPFCHLDTTQSNDLCVQDLPWKHARMSNFPGLGRATLVAMITVESQSSLRGEVHYVVAGRSPKVAEQSFPLVGNFDLQDEPAATKWLLNALVEGYDTMRQAAAGVASY